MPPDEGTQEERAFQIKLQISEAPFVLSRSQYAEILHTLDQNIGEADLFVRDEECNPEHLLGATNAVDSTSDLLQGLTHGGAELVDNPRRIKLDIQMRALSLLLCGFNANDPLIHVEAVEADIALHMISDESRMTTDVSLKELVCKDRRIKSLGRQHRCLIYQAGGKREQEGKQDVFTIRYETNQDSSSNLEVEVGSPHLVFIPDAVSDALAFFNVDRAKKQESVSPSLSSPSGVRMQERVEVEAHPELNEIEASIFQTKVNPSVSSSISIKTARCSLMLVDLASSLLGSSQTKVSIMSTQKPALSEVLVFEG